MRSITPKCPKTELSVHCAFVVACDGGGLLLFVERLLCPAPTVLALVIGFVKRKNDTITVNHLHHQETNNRV